MSGRTLRRWIARCLNHLFAPGLCLACGGELGDANSLCASCSNQLQRVPNPCQYCGQPNPVGGLVCPACLLNPPRWQKLIAPLQYRGLVRDYLIQLKFSEALYLAKSLGQECIDPFRQSQPRPEVLLPVPLHHTRLFERGYNQAYEIANVLSGELGIPIDRHALIRTRPTQSQSGLSSPQRESNIRKAFAYAPKHEYRHVALIDDIVTTGSTVTEITGVLHHGGVEYVEVWALARVYRR